MKLRTVDLRPGMIVTYKSRMCRIEYVSLSGNVRLSTGEGEDLEAPATDLSVLKVSGLHLDRLRPFAEYPSEFQLEAIRRKQVFDALIAQPHWTFTAINQACEKLAISKASVYKLAGWYLFSGCRPETLIPKVFKFGKATRSLAPDVESIIRLELRTYLDDKSVSMASVQERIETACARINLRPPSLSTLRRRIAAMAPKEVLAARKGVKAARDKYGPLTGRTPTGMEPLEICEMDDTPLNILCKLRGGGTIRLNLCLLIDRYSRMVVGLYISPGGPSSVSAGMTIYSALLPKDDLLRRLGLVLPWPIFGPIKQIHTDSGRNFAGTYFENVCMSEDIHETKRKKESPEGGGIIERMMGRAAMAMELFPGKTFRNVLERGAYQSEEKATMYYEEIVRAFVVFIAKYHQDPHSGLRGRPPIFVFNEWVRNNPERARQLQQERPNRDLYMSLLPFHDRTIQKAGVHWKGSIYDHPAIKPFIAIPNKNLPGGKWRFHQDPGNVNHLFWKHPNTGVWHKLLATDTGMGAISQWDYESIQAEDRQIAKDSIDHKERQSARELFHGIVDEANARSLKELKAKAKEKSRSKGRPKADSASPLQDYSVRSETSRNENDDSIWGEAENISRGSI